MKQLFTLILIALTSFCFAQDTIYSLNGDRTIGRVTEIDPTYVHVKAGTEGHMHDVLILKRGISKVVYQGGLQETYHQQPTLHDKILADSSHRLPLNYIAVNAIDMGFGDLTVSYERILGKKGKLGVKVPVSVGVGVRPVHEEYSTTASTDYLRNRIFGTGLELNFYPYGQARTTFYYGLSAEYGQFNYYHATYYSYYYNQPAIINRYTGSHAAALMHLGMNIGLSKHVFLGFRVGFGYKWENTVFTDYTQFKVQADAVAGYRF